MKPKRLTRGVTFTATNEMHTQLHKIAKDEKLGLGELMRMIVEQYFLSKSKEQWRIM